LEYILKIFLSKKTKHWVVNVIVASLWAYYSYLNVLFLHTKWHIASQLILLIHISLFIRNSSLTIFFLIRHSPKESSFKVKEWIIAIYGTFIGYLYASEGAVALVPAKLVFIIYLLMVIIIFSSILSIFSLGRSFAILPKDRLYVHSHDILIVAISQYIANKNF